MDDNRATDVTAINAVLEDVYKAWAASDADAFVAQYTEDASAILPGSVRLGREEIRKSMAGGFAGPLKGSSTVNVLKELRFPSTDTAIAVTESGVKMAGETEVPASRMVIASWVLVRRRQEWLVAAYHNSPRDPANH